MRLNGDACQFEVAQLTVTHQDELLTFVRLERRTEVLVRLIVLPVFTMKQEIF